MKMVSCFLARWPFTCRISLAPLHKILLLFCHASSLYQYNIVYLLYPRQICLLIAVLVNMMGRWLLKKKWWRDLRWRKRYFCSGLERGFRYYVSKVFFSLVYGIFNLKTNDLPEYLFHLGLWYTKFPMALEGMWRILGVLCWHNYFHCSDKLQPPGWPCLVDHNAG